MPELPRSKERTKKTQEREGERGKTLNTRKTVKTPPHGVAGREREREREREKQEIFWLPSCSCWCETELV